MTAREKQIALFKAGRKEARSHVKRMSFFEKRALSPFAKKQIAMIRKRHELEVEMFDLLIKHVEEAA